MAKKVTQGTRKPKKNKVTKAKPEALKQKDSADIIKVQMRTEVLAERENEKGQQKIVALPWGHAVHYLGKLYKAGDEFEVPTALGERLILSGTCQKAGTKLKPFSPKNLKPREMVMVHGVVKGEDRFGKVPVYEQTKGNKGEWDDTDLDD